MPTFDFSQHEEMRRGEGGGWTERVLVPEGDYLAEIHDIETAYSTDGVEVWTVQWRILDGAYQGQLVKDWFRWGDLDPAASNRNLGRVKLVCRALGFPVDVAGPLEYHPDDFKGRRAQIRTYHYTNARGRTYANVSLDGVYAEGEVLPPKKPKPQVPAHGGQLHPAHPGAPPRATAPPQARPVLPRPPGRPQAPPRAPASTREPPPWVKPGEYRQAIPGTLLPLPGEGEAVPETPF